jgi:hypothetical protein
MWDFLKANPFIVGALTGSLAAYLLGLLVSYIHREKRWLGYSVSSRNIVQKGHSKLEMKYDGRDIVRLDSHAIQLRNIGNRPLNQTTRDWHTRPVILREAKGLAARFFAALKMTLPKGSRCKVYQCHGFRFSATAHPARIC